MTGKAIVIRDAAGHAKLAAVPAGWEGGTVDVDDRTAAWLIDPKAPSTFEEQAQDIARIGPDGRSNDPKGVLMPCEQCGTFIVKTKMAQHIRLQHGVA